MTVWILFGREPYESSFIVGVFSTKEAADKAMSDMPLSKNNEGYDFWIEDHQVKESS